MTVEVSFPGVYLREIPSQSHTIPGVTTSDTAFVDIFPRGPANVATRISSVGEFTATFGGLAKWSRASYGIYQYFLNGGSTAWVVRVAPATAETASADLKDFTLEAIGPGSWGSSLRAATQCSAPPPGPATNGSGSPVDSAGMVVIDLVVQETATNPSTGVTSVVAREVYRKLSLTAGDPNYVVDVLAQNSSLVDVQSNSVKVPKESPKASPYDATKDITSGAIAGVVADGDPFTAFSEVTDVTVVAGADLMGGPGDPDATVPTPPTGIYALAHITPNVFNIMCLPATSLLPAADAELVLSAAYKFCEQQRAFLIVDTPQTWDQDVPAAQIKSVQQWYGTYVSNQTDHAAVYFPRLSMPDPDPSAAGRLTPTEASGTIAGIYASTDASRGTWKAPAGTLAVIAGASPAFEMLDADNGQLNELGINSLRTFPVYGSVVWGARTARGADALESEWKYVPVRRLALYIEDSLFQGTKWAVFEPNGETLWSSLRLSVGAFMQDLYRRGAFAGTSAKEAFFVQCDATTTTPTDQANGIVNVLVGFAPLYPAEFVVLQISQIAAT